MFNSHKIKTSIVATMFFITCLYSTGSSNLTRGDTNPDPNNFVCIGWSATAELPLFRYGIYLPEDIINSLETEVGQYKPINADTLQRLRKIIPELPLNANFSAFTQQGTNIRSILVRLATPQHVNLPENPSIMPLCFVTISTARNLTQLSFTKYEGSNDTLYLIGSNNILESFANLILHRFSLHNSSEIPAITAGSDTYEHLRTMSCQTDTLCQFADLIPEELTIVKDDKGNFFVRIPSDSHPFRFMIYSGEFVRPGLLQEGPFVEVFRRFLKDTPA